MYSRSEFDSAERTWELGWINGPDYDDADDEQKLEASSIMGLLRRETDEDSTGRDFDDFDKAGLIESIMVNIEDDPEALKEILCSIADKKDSHPHAFKALKDAVDDFVERGGEWQ